MNTQKAAGPHRVANEPRAGYAAQVPAPGAVLMAEPDLGDAAGDDAARDELRRAIGERLSTARGARQRRDVAMAVGVHVNTLGKWERGDATPDAVDLLRLADVLRRPVTWLLCQGGEAAEPGLVAPASTAVAHGLHLFVPRFDVSAAAGHGAFNDAETVRDMRPFTVEYIRSTLGIGHDDLALVSVIGPSMEPDIHSGDIVLVDRRDTAIAIEGPHLVRIDGALLVKLCQRRPGGVVRIASRNPAYEPFDIDLSKSGVSDFEVLGRVRWAGVTFR